LGAFLQDLVITKLLLLTAKTYAALFDSQLAIAKKFSLALGGLSRSGINGELFASWRATDNDRALL
jgi:hypothetical protein